MAAGIIPVFSVGDRFRKARELTGMSRGEFAALLGVHRETVTRYEEVGTTKLQAVAAWAKITGVDPDWLVPAAGEGSAAVPAVALAAARDAIVREHGVEQLVGGGASVAAMGDPAEIATTALAAAVRSGAMTVAAATVGARAR